MEPVAQCAFVVVVSEYAVDMIKIPGEHYAFRGFFVFPHGIAYACAPARACANGEKMSNRGKNQVV